jgi:hypothetical protein
MRSLVVATSHDSIRDSLILIFMNISNEGLSILVIVAMPKEEAGTVTLQCKELVVHKRNTRCLYVYNVTQLVPTLRE